MKQPDIHTLHAELVHAAAEIQFVLNYDNNGQAVILDIDQKNVQRALEKYFSIHGIPVYGELPTGLKNGVNLEFTTGFEFVEGSLEVYLSGLKLNGNINDPDRDYTPYIDNDGFTIHLDPNKAWRLNKAPKQNEPFYINYKKRITFNTKGGT